MRSSSGVRKQSRGSPHAEASSRLSRVQPGQRFAFTPDETGEPLEARVKRLGARIDEGSQTLLLIGSLPEKADGLLSGMSGSARFTEAP